MGGVLKAMKIDKKGFHRYFLPIPVKFTSYFIIAETMILFNKNHK